MRLLTIALLVLMLFLIGCDSPAADNSHSVKYEITGTGSITRANVTYRDLNGEWAHDDNTLLPWTYSCTRNEGAYVYVSGQIGEGTGTITARILKDGQLLDEDSSDDPTYRAIASGYI